MIVQGPDPPGALAGLFQHPIRHRRPGPDGQGQPGQTLPALPDGVLCPGVRVAHIVVEPLQRAQVISALALPFVLERLGTQSGIELGERQIAERVDPAVVDPLVVRPEMGAPVGRQWTLLRHDVLDAEILEQIGVQRPLAVVVLERDQHMLGTQAAVQIGRFQCGLEFLVGRETGGFGLQKELNPDVLEVARRQQARAGEPRESVGMRPGMETGHGPAKEVILDRPDDQGEVLLGETALRACPRRA